MERGRTRGLRNRMILGGRAMLIHRAMAAARLGYLYTAALCTAALLSPLAVAQSSAPVITPAPAQVSPAPRPSPPLPTEAFAALPFVEMPSLSPNGTHMAGLFGASGTQNIVIAPIFGKDPKLVTLEVPDMNEVDWIRWVGDDNIIVGLRALRGVEGSSWYVYRMIGVNRINRKVTRILWDAGGQMASNVLHVPTDGSKHILVSAQDSIYTNYPEFWPAVYRVDVTTGGKTMVQRPRNNLLWWAADDQARIRIGRASQQGGIRSILYYRSDSDGALRSVQRVNLAEDEEHEIPFHFVPNSDRAFVLESRTDGHRAIVEADMKSGANIRTIYDEHPVEGLILGPNGSKLLGAYIQNRDQRIHWFDPALAAHQKTLEAASPASDAEILSLSHDQSKMLVRFSTADNPGLLFYFDAATGDLSRLAAMNDKIGGRRLSRSDFVQYKARDGLDIEAILTMPRGRRATNLPMIVLPHGGPWAHDQLGYHYIVQFLAERGYAVLQPNFRGSTGYGDRFEKAGRGQMGLAMQDDLTDGVRWAVEQGIADPKRLCIAGSSYGGYAAMWGIAKDPDLYRCAISINGVSSLRREVNDFGGSIHSRLFRQQWDKMSDDFDAISPINAISRITAPLLLIHGKKDVTVDHSQSSRMHSAMIRAGKKSIFTSVPKADHYFARQADRETMLKSMEAFLHQHNPPDP